MDLFLEIFNCLFLYRSAYTISITHGDFDFFRRAWAIRSTHGSEIILSRRSRTLRSNITTENASKSFNEVLKTQNKCLDILYAAFETKGTRR